MIDKPVHAFVFTVCLALVACAPEPGPPPAAAEAERARLEAIASRVEIIRDDFGVPHVYGKSDADAIFGLLYAQAEDDFPRIERNYVWATGRLAEVEGERAIFSDLRARLYMTEDEAKAAYASAPDWLRALCDAWADGLNYFLLTHPEVRPQLLMRFEPWMPMFFSEGSIGGDIEKIPLERIAQFYGGDEAEESIAAAQGVEQEFAPGGGSNGFAITGEHTRSGDAMLLINPHTSFYFRGEVHAVSEEGLNAYGAVTWGQFFVYQGFNENTGWMHTSTYVDFIDEFVEDVRRVDGELVYRYGEEMRPVDVSTVKLKYKDGDGTAERTFEVYHTHHGPVTHAIDGKWTVTKINWDPVKALIQSFTRTKLDNYAEFREMMDIRTNSSNNTVFADSTGNIAYFHGNFIPRRDARFDYSQPVDGSDPATDWQGLHTVDEAVTVLNPPNGWIQNANSTPFTSAAQFSPKREDYPTYMAPDSENFRGVHAVRVLTDVDDLTLDSLIELAHDPYLPGFEKLIGGLLEAWDEAGQQDPAIAAAMEVMQAWDLKTGLDSVAMSLAHFYGMNYLARGVAPEGTSEMQRIDYLGTGTAPAERLEVFAETVAMLQKDFGDWRVPWGKINRFQRLSGAIDLDYDDDAPSLAVDMANSRWGALADFGAKRFDGTKRLYGSNGNSFVAVVEFGDRVRARSILVGGQSNDPDSPHFDDQAPLYAAHEFKEVAFYRDDVEHRAEERYRPGKRRRGAGAQKP
ncbi:MAG: acylase [Gammaproteobacteria bacterium]|nr:acylase [Gammaproteobacteria bacterium]